MLPGIIEIFSSLITTVFSNFVTSTFESIVITSSEYSITFSASSSITISSFEPIKSDKITSDSVDFIYIIGRNSSSIHSNQPCSIETTASSS